MQYRVMIQEKPGSQWRHNGITETNLEAATKAWTSIIQRLNRHAFRLEPIATS
jgi:hypothetical protein